MGRVGRPARRRRRRRRRRERKRARTDATGWTDGPTKRERGEFSGRECERGGGGRADGRPRTGRRRACAVRKGIDGEGNGRAGAPSTGSRGKRGTRWDATAATAAKREGTAARRRCVSLLAPANCRGQPALAEELTELSRTPRKQAGRQADRRANRRASRQTTGYPKLRPDSTGSRCAVDGCRSGNHADRFSPRFVSA